MPKKLKLMAFVPLLLVPIAYVNANSVDMFGGQGPQIYQEIDPGRAKKFLYDSGSAQAGNQQEILSFVDNYIDNSPSVPLNQKASMKANVREYLRQFQNLPPDQQLMLKSLVVDYIQSYNFKTY